jgi:hypothetical protein
MIRKCSSYHPLEGFYLNHSKNVNKMSVLVRKVKDFPRLDIDPGNCG